MEHRRTAASCSVKIILGLDFLPAVILYQILTKNVLINKDYFCQTYKWKIDFPKYFQDEPKYNTVVIQHTFLPLMGMEKSIFKPDSL